MRRIKFLILAMMAIVVASGISIQAQSTGSRPRSSSTPKPQNRPQTRPQTKPQAKPENDDNRGLKGEGNRDNDDVRDFFNRENGGNGGMTLDQLNKKLFGNQPGGEKTDSVVTGVTGVPGVQGRPKTQSEDPIQELIDKATNGEESEAGDAAYELGTYYYVGSNGVEKDLEEAFAWFTKSARLGNIQGMIMEATCYYYGDGVKKNEQTARRKYLEALDRDPEAVLEFLEIMAGDGDLFFITLLRDIYENGSEKIEKDVNKALQYTKKAAELGDVDSQYAVAKYYYDRGNEEMPRDTIFRYFDEAAKKNNIMATYFRGVMLWNGDGVTMRDEAGAIRDLKKAADAGIVAAKAQLGEIYLNGTAQDKKRGLELTKEAAEAHNKQAMWNLANCYRTGLMDEKNQVIVQRDYYQAATWMSLVANDAYDREYKSLIEQLQLNNDPYYRYLLGLNAYYHENYDEALEIFAGLEGEAWADAITMEGACHIGKNDFKQAEALLTKVTSDFQEPQSNAKRKPVPAACYFLAEMLIETKAQVHANEMKQYDQKDKDRIKNLLKTAADAGNGLAQCRLGYMHLIGDNTIVEKDADKGKHYLMMSEDQMAFTELPQAASELARLYENGIIKSNMSQDELSKHIFNLRDININRDKEPYNPMLKMLDATAF